MHIYMYTYIYMNFKLPSFCFLSIVYSRNALGISLSLPSSTFLL